MTWRAELIRPRLRLISDNDYCGDPDGLVQLAHHLLCASVDVRLVIGSAVGEHHPAWSQTCATDSVNAAVRVAELADRADVPVLAGSSSPLQSDDEPATSPAAEAIVAEAMRDDTDLPLVVACGGGLTTVASAWLLEPRITERITVVWIGGHEYGARTVDLPADARRRETNVNIDILASKLIFNHSRIPLWQIPMDVYSDVVISRSEALVRMRPRGPLGSHLFEMIGARVDAWSQGLRMGETYSLGDSPLVSVTALSSAYQTEAESCRWLTRPRPLLNDDGLYSDTVDGGNSIRLYTHIDSRLLLEDLYAKLQVHAEAR